jgi:hypothetical protein
MNKVRQLSGLLGRLESKYGLNYHKVRMLSIASVYWEEGALVRVGDILNAYEDTSRATTHRAIRELVSSKVLREEVSGDDRRVKFLQPGLKFDVLLKDIGKLL